MRRIVREEERERERAIAIVYELGFGGGLKCRRLAGLARTCHPEHRHAAERRLLKE
jgi:hypothetical protein